MIYLLVSLGYSLEPNLPGHVPNSDNEQYMHRTNFVKEKYCSATCLKFSAFNFGVTGFF
jgi:hypothetical protein